MKKKVVFLPYDFDTALGTNNEGALEFSYNLDDTDTIGGGKDVFNGQQSVLWKNVRACFYDRVKAMYQNLRSSGKLSYDIVEKMFEDHQSVYPEALVNEDSQFTYLDPLVNPDPGKQPTAAYLGMLQGLKTEQRKWWLYNRIRNKDSEFNAGDALVDVITLRGYAKDNIKVIPYADIYASVKYGSYLVQKKAPRNVEQTLECPLSNVNDTEIYIYSASQLASIGDVSGFLVGYADFSYATRLQSLKIGDSSAFYTNENLLDLYLGSNVLLEVIDARNCVNLGGERTIGGDRVLSKTPSPDLSGCIGLKEAYFDNTSVKGIVFPVGGPLRVVHLPATITNLTLRNLTKLTDLTVASYANVTTLRLENCSSVVDPVSILNQIQDNSRVRLVGFRIDVSSTSEIDAFYAKLDKMRGLDEYGNTLDNAAAVGTIHIGSIDGDDAAAYKARYPYITIDADRLTCTLTYKTYDGASVIDTETVVNKGNGTKTNSTSRASDAQYTYTPNGWSLELNGDPDSDALVAVDTDRTVYAAYTKTLQKYTVTWKNSNGTTLETDTNVEYGTTPTYNGSTPVDPSGSGSPFTTWTPDVAPVTGNVTYTASYKPIWTVTFKSQDGATTLGTSKVIDGGTATYSGETPTNADNTTFLGWAASANATENDANILKNITASKTVYAAFEVLVEVAEITDSWDQIISSIDDGTYKTKYKLGNYKPLDLGDEGTVNMQIVAKDGDQIANGQTVPLSFVSIETLLVTKASTGYSNTDRSWRTSALRSNINENIKPIFSSTHANIWSRIPYAKKVSQTSGYSAGMQGSSTTYDKLWVPSAYEVGDTSVNKEATNPVRYTKIYHDNNSRVKYPAGTTPRANYEARWALRTSGYYTTPDFYVKTDGKFDNNSSGLQVSVCIGFCLATEDQARIIDTNEFLRSMTANTYSTDYSVGDMFPIDLGTEGQNYAQIVAFDADDKSDGSGKAKVSLITKDLLNSNHAMNSSETTKDGWVAMTMRSYLAETIKPLIPVSISDRIVSVNKTYNGGTSSDQISADELWIPSIREMTADTSYEKTGPEYTALFKDAASRKKKRLNTTTEWWTRSASDSSRFRYIRSDGYTTGGNYATNPNLGIALGFCLD